MSLTWSPQVAMNKEEIDGFLNEKHVARIASLRKDGYAHLTPVWYLWENDLVYFILGRGERPRQHIGNLRRDPRITVLIDKDIRPQEGNLRPGAQGVLIRGEVELFEDEQSQTEVSRKILARYLKEDGEKYLQAVLADGSQGINRTVVKVKPRKILAWDFTKLKLA